MADGWNERQKPNRLWSSLFSDFGQIRLCQTDFGQKNLTDFGQPDFGQLQLADCGQFLCFTQKGAPKNGPRWVGAQTEKKWGPEGWGPEKWGPKFRACFPSLSRRTIRSFHPSLGVFSFPATVSHNTKIGQSHFGQNHHTKQVAL